uniref:Uncharacterized protein n=1 Tax=Helianthus annuus TaxID=4232 RepID=A0A251UMT6_HELAN
MLTYNCRNSPERRVRCRNNEGCRKPSLFFHSRLPVVSIRNLFFFNLFLARYFQGIFVRKNCIQG